MNPNKQIAFRSLEEVKKLSSLNYFNGIKPKGSWKKKFFANEYLIKRFVWRLEEFESRYQTNEKIRYAHPSQKITPDFTSELVLENLNFSNCFDFDYAPKENDLLHISMDYVFEYFRGHERDVGPIWGYMLFEFENGQWNAVRFNPGETIYNTIAKGVVFIENSAEQSK